MSTRQIKSLCLHENGTIGLKPSLMEHTTDTWQLEDTIDSFLQDNVKDAPTVHIGMRHDAHWVKSRKPVVPPQTVLGIWEDVVVDPEEEEQVNPPVVLSIHQSTVSTNGSHGHHQHKRQVCSCTAPHSEWTRTRQLPIESGPDSLKPVHVHWVDIRQWQQQGDEDKTALLENPASVCYFLRSLLGSSHSSSPWVATQSEQQEDEPDVVALVMMRHPPEALTEFRVGNASPSFYLHSTSQLLLPPKDVNWIALKPPSQESYSFGDLMESTLLVFRRLAPRDYLSIRHPLAESHEEESLVPEGCLWEAYLPNRHENEDNEEQHELQYRLLCPPYVSHKQEYPDLLEPLLTTEKFQTIREEAMSIPQWTAWPEKAHYSSKEGEGASWTVFPLCHCFPANLVENRKWINSTCAFVPQTTALLQKHLGDVLRTALFSRLDAQTTLEPHTGWQDLANHVFRVHLPLVVPDGGLCGTWVDGCVETHQERRLVCFDDAKVHRAFNYSDHERVVLILDLARPETLPPGTAQGGHTDELDKFIKQLT